MKVQTRLYEILEKAEEGDSVSKAVDVFLVSLILLNVFVVVVETVQWLRVPYAQQFRYFEIFSITVFTSSTFCACGSAPRATSSSIP